MLAPRLLISLVIALLLIPVINTQAQERLCDTAFEDCRTPLWQLIDAETQGIDVAFWFMQDSSYATKLINRFKAGVPVRVLVDPRANPTYAGNEAVLNMWHSDALQTGRRHPALEDDALCRTGQGGVQRRQLLRQLFRS